MTKYEFRMLLQKIELQNFYNPLWNVYVESDSNLRDQALEHCFGLDYDSVSNRYSYFKKSFTKYLEYVPNNKMDEELLINDNLAAKIVNFLISKKIISSYNYKSYLFTIDSLIKKYDEDVLVVAFDYSYSKLLQMIKLGEIDSSKVIHSPVSYFMKSLEINAVKCTGMNLNKNEINEIRKYLYF